jgi:cytidylate kinase
MKDKITIAIDGWSSCGKSTLAKALAKSLGYIYVDSGAMYRGVALYAIQNDLVNDETIDSDEIVARLSKLSIRFEKNDAGTPDLILNGQNVEAKIRSLEVSQQVSKVAAIKEVRSFLVDQQRKMGEDGGVVMDGRDIGSVVFPNAELKLFITADPEIRAQRRYKELKDKGDDITIQEVEQNLQQRDHLDATREESPLIQTDDAIVIDNSSLTPEEQLEKALSLVKNKLVV